MMSCTDDDELRNLVKEEKSTSVILDAGYTKTLRTATLLDKQSIIRTVFLHSVVYRSMAERDWEMKWKDVQIALKASLLQRM